MPPKKEGEEVKTDPDLAFEEIRKIGAFSNETMIDGVKGVITFC